MVKSDHIDKLILPLMLILRIGLFGLDRCFFCFVMTGSPQFASGLQKEHNITWYKRINVLMII